MSRVLVVPMPIRPCLRCQTPTPRGLEEVNRNEQLAYYRFDQCGHVWHMAKSFPVGPISDWTDDPSTH
jgi:hypothetical protein